VVEGYFAAGIYSGYSSVLILIYASLLSLQGAVCYAFRDTNTSATSREATGERRPLLIPLLVEYGKVIYAAIENCSLRSVRVIRLLELFLILLLRLDHILALLFERLAIAT
jgi:hypothetical protein